MNVPSVFMSTTAPAETPATPVTVSADGPSVSVSLSSTLPVKATAGKPVGLTPTSTSVLPTAPL